MKKKMIQQISSFIVVCMLVALIPSQWIRTAEADGLISTNTEYLETQVYGSKIVNHKDMPSWSRSYEGDDLNAFTWFFRATYPCGASLAGVLVTFQGDDLDCNDKEFTDKDIDHVNGFFRGSINVGQIPVLKRVAEGGTAKLLVKVGKLDSTSDHGAYIKVFINGAEKWYAHSTSSEPDLLNVDSNWISFGPNDTILLQTETNGAGTTVNNIRLYFADIDQPTITDYTFTSDGTERDNTIIDQKELFLKKGESLNLTYNFSEAVKAQQNYLPTNPLYLGSHALFTNPAGTGLPAAGQNQSMVLNLDSAAAKDFLIKLPYQYTASDYQHTGNLPIDKGGELTEKAINNGSLWTKIDEAAFHDAAGNPLQMSGFNKVNSSSSTYLTTIKEINPFQYGFKQGYRVIIDAVPPKYSLTANGIQPDILTGSTLNNGDVIDFKVQLTEDVIVKEGWTNEGLFLYFNNGMKAKYVAGANSKVWTFRAVITKDDVDVSLLKAIALTHESKGDKSDKGVLQDYAGNLLMDSANASKSTNSDPSQAVPNTKIDWAQLSIDNTKPVINYIYDASSATAATYKKTAKITIDATDPPIVAPQLDPDEPGRERPSRGIYRPVNMTGTTPNSSPGVGLVYYYWSQSSEDPLAAKEADHFAAIKRYSLTGQQPKQGLYPGDLESFELLVANNKTNMLAPPPEALTSAKSGKWYLHTWTADMTWDTARELMQYKKMQSFQTSQAAKFQQWIQEYKSNNPGGSDADAEVYAQNKAFLEVGKYSDIANWPLSDYKQDDSNWTYSKAEISLDNTKPEVTAGAPNGNNSAQVTVPVVIQDAHSGLDPSKLVYQWVKAGGKPTEISWTLIPQNQIITTLNQVIEDGDYELYIKAADKAGNELLFKLAQTVTVNSDVTVQTSFAPNASTQYVQSHDIKFGIKGVDVEKVEYAFSSSSTRPAANLYKNITSSEEIVNSYSYYKVPADHTLNGIRYVHMKIKEKNLDRYYYYYMPYKFDNTAPTASFSLTSVNYAKESHRVVVTTQELYSPNGMATKYQWIRSTEAAPGKASAGWLELPEGGEVAVDNRLLNPGETTDYVLYVYTTDGAGNSAIQHTGPFKVIKQADAPVVVSKTDIIYGYGDAADGYYAVLNLELENTSKEGIEYSLSSNEGATWSPWAPYSNFVKVQVEKLDANQLNKLKARFKSASGKISDITNLNTNGYAQQEPVYAIAVHSTLQTVNELSLRIELSAGIKVVPSSLAVNPMVPIRLTGNTFKVTQNGCYSFELTDTVDSSRSATLLVVVNNIDNTPPIGTIEYKITKKTNSNVLVKLNTSEAVRILNNEGRNSYIFSENGSFTFEFEDEAGNKATTTATVSNIDSTPPNAQINKSYTYGTNGSKTFKTIVDESGEVILTQGLTLEVQKTNPSDKDFVSVRGDGRTTLYKNGKAEFVIRDDMGNTSVLEEEVTHIVSSVPDPTSITYQFVDDQGNPLPVNDIKQINHKPYAKGKIKVSINGKVDSRNQAFWGTVPVEADGTYTNLISDEDGNYSYSFVYSANGEKTVALSDLLGNINKVRIHAEGLDNTAPAIALKLPLAAIAQNKAGYNPAVDLGGYTVSDNVSQAENIRVSVSYLDLSRLGTQTVTYTVKDEVGNITTATQKVVVLPKTGLLIVGNEQILSSAMGESILFDQNEITFSLSGFNEMTVNGQKVINERGQYDIYYQSGLYREGQMKYIAQKISMQQLLNNEFKVTFPETGWYTIIVRTQEREREYATFFIGKVNKK